MVDIISEREQKVLTYFPEFAQRSAVIRSFTKIIAEEQSSRIGDLAEVLKDNMFVQRITELSIAEWKDLYEIVTSQAEAIELTKGRIADKSIRTQKFRGNDIANIVRQYMSGNKTYVLNASVSTNRVVVKDITGFVPSQAIYVGTQTVNIVSIDAATSTFVIDRLIPLVPYVKVTDAYVLIEEDYAAYTFVINVPAGTVSDLPGLVIAVEAAKPAHLGFSVVEINPITYDEAGITYDDATVGYNGPLVLYTTG